MYYGPIKPPNKPARKYKFLSEELPASAPTIKIKIALTSTIYRCSAPHSGHPQLLVTSTLVGPPSLLTVEIRGETDSGTVLVPPTTSGWRRRMEHFAFHDLTTDMPVLHDLFPGTCDPWDHLEPDHVIELHSSKPHFTSQTLSDSPFSDPVNILETGHEYRVTLKPQRVRCWMQSIDEIFGGEKEVIRERSIVGKGFIEVPTITRKIIENKDLPQWIEVLLASDDELFLKVED